MTQQTELGRLIGDWDAKDPASEQSTALLLVLLEMRKLIEDLQQQVNHSHAHEHRVWRA